jgi:hypothetical protein
MLDNLLSFLGRPRPKITASTKETAAERIQSIVNKYGLVLERSYALICDISELPYPKREIKMAILAMISFSDEKDDCRDLKVGYLKLASFQALTQVEKEAVSLHEHLASDMAFSRDLRQVAKLISRVWPTYNAILEKVAAEEAQLKRELDAIIGEYKASNSDRLIKS